MNIALDDRAKHMIRRLFFLAYLLGVLAATLAPLSGEAYDAVSGFDKLVHVVLFGGVAALLSWNLSSLDSRSAVAVFAVTVTFAALIEVVQSALRYRSGDFWDLLAGALGALLGVCFGLALERWRSRTGGQTP